MKLDPGKPSIEYLLGVPFFTLMYVPAAFLLFLIAQGDADSHVTPQWYFSIAGFFVAYPFLRLANAFPLLAVLALQGTFWGFVVVFSIRILEKFRDDRNRKPSIK
ncbi:MAG TPA: hypothetical protein VGM54_24480 [Chthoniobacter sp.]|jgi:hypothetical protein